MGKLLKHLKTVRTHRKHVRRMCWRMGLVWQGLVHDLSKYSVPELRMCRYWTGEGSPHQACRDAIGFSPSWIHHYHRNKHHFQYWWDEDELGRIIPIKMPYRYAIESFCDMVGASMAYNPKGWEPRKLTSYWEAKCKGKRIMNEESAALVERLIYTLDSLGLEGFLKWYRDNRRALEEEYGKAV